MFDQIQYCKHVKYYNMWDIISWFAEWCVEACKKLHACEYNTAVFLYMNTHLREHLWYLSFSL